MVIQIKDGGVVSRNFGSSFIGVRAEKIYLLKNEIDYFFKKRETVEVAKQQLKAYINEQLMPCFEEDFPDEDKLILIDHESGKRLILWNYIL